MRKIVIKPFSKQYKKKMWLAMLVMAAASLVLIFTGPFESLAFAGNAMRYTHRDVWHLLLLVASMTWVAGTFLLPLLKGKAFRWTITAVFGLTVCGYLQTVLMNRSLGLLDGHRLVIGPGKMLLNLVIWAVLMAAGFVVLNVSRRYWRMLLRFGSVLLAVMQLASVGSIVLGNATPAPDLENYCLSDKGMYEYSGEENIFVFVLDRLDYTYLEGVLAEDPDYFDGMDGFTWYTNAMSAYGRTQPALNHLLTGSETAFTVSKDDFYADSWHEEGKALLEDLDRLGYTTELYTNIRYLFSDAEYAVRYADNAVSTGVLQSGVVLPKLLKLAAYRCAPLILKNLFWADTNYYNENVYVENGQDPYEFEDPYYGPGFATATADRKEKGFHFYHFTGSHAPYTMDAQGKASQTETDVTAQTMGSFLHLFNAFDRMKELGIYEDATIIITGDHGSAYMDSAPLQKKVTIGLFYKPSGSAGTPLAYSSAPVSTDNIGATIVKAAGLADYSAYGPALDEVAEDAQITRYYYKSVAEKETWHEVSVYRYAVVGDANDYANWTLVDVLEPLDKENRFY